MPDQRPTAQEPVDVRAAKRALRDRMRAGLAAIDPAERQRASAVIAQRLLAWDVIQRAGAVMLFMATPQEPDLGPVAAALLASGKAACFPRVDWVARSIWPVAVPRPDFATTIQRHGVREPTEGVNLSPTRLAVVLTPGLAFDARGGRLGRGGGFYDRFLSIAEAEGWSGWAVGVGFERQMVDSVPAETTDARLRAVVTEDRLTIC
ncbi:MAG: 5-formyltetrahydrofolate cyclo-ligase [Phycisphaerales bacterium]|nr:5-formyltetrahydrofolate cyclo-ligase [Phycisphaerales bacterium]